MPAKNAIKIYIENGFYHVYNRGVEKRNIFLDNQDFQVFISYLKIYLLPTEESVVDVQKDIESNKKNIKNQISKLYKINNFFNKIELISYVLMPNHFHLELKQKNKQDLEIFMRSLITKYTMYFNRKYKRVGPLFQSRYKAILIQSKEYLLHLSRYIYINPMEIINHKLPLTSYPWSSYPSYINNYPTNWINKKYIFEFFYKNEKAKIKSYKEFVENYLHKTEEEEKIINNLLLDKDSPV